MRYSAVRGTFDGAPTCVLRDSEADLTISVLPGFGANMISLVFRGVEFMRVPPGMEELADAPNRYGNPVLMPPNRIWRGQCTFEGCTYNFPLTDKTGLHHIHGLVKSCDWRVERLTADETGAYLTVSVSAMDHDGIKASMPIDWTLYLDFTVAGGRVDLNARISNNDKVSMPFGIGFHPYFNTPLAGPGPQDNCFVKCPGSFRWELEECFPTCDRLPVEGEKDLTEWRSLEGLRLDDIYSGLPLEDGRYRTAFEDRTAGLGLEVSAGPEYPHWVLFTGTEDSYFLCLEPYTMITNAFNLDLPLEESGMIALKPGQGFEGMFSFRPYAIG